MKKTTGLGKIFLLSAGLLVLAASPVLASSVCPIPNSGTSGTEGVDATYLTNSGVTDGGCNVLITFGSGGGVVTTFPNAQGYYDAGADDNLVGIVNNSGAAITAISLSSVNNIFGFESPNDGSGSDGICSNTGYGFTTGTYAQVCTNILDPLGYGGPGVTFTPTDSFSGVVNFAGAGIADGATAWFSLEAPVDLTIAATNGAPEPASMALIGGGLSALYFVRRRRKA